MCVARRESVCSARCSHDGVAALGSDDLRRRWLGLGRRGPRGSVSVMRDWMGLGSSLTATRRPRSFALLLGWLLLSIPPVSSVVCSSCKDTIPGCKVALIGDFVDTRVGN